MAKKQTKYIIAVKDYENTVKKLISGEINTGRDADVYKTLFDNVLFSCSNMSELKKYIKKNKYNKKDCEHYWESLLSNNKTLITVTYDTDDENFIENTCDNEYLTYVSSWIK